MSAIEASSVSVKTMADGTLRLTVDIEPRFALDACRLFMAPGTPMALAALRAVSHAEPAPEQPEKPKGGPLAKLAGMWCADERFRAWLKEAGDFAGDPLTEIEAAAIVREWCGDIESRADLDNISAAGAKFDKHIRHPYMAHLKSVGA